MSVFPFCLMIFWCVAVTIRAKTDVAVIADDGLAPVAVHLRLVDLPLTEVTRPHAYRRISHSTCSGTGGLMLGR